MTYGLLDFLLQRAEVLRIEKLNQRDIQAVAQHFDGDDARVLACAVEDVLHRRRRHSGTARQCVDGQMPLLTELNDALCYAFPCCHVERSPYSV